MECVLQPSTLLEARSIAESKEVAIKEKNRSQRNTPPQRPSGSDGNKDPSKGDKGDRDQKPNKPQYTEEQKLRYERMKQGLCLVCGKKGHRKADCPNKDSMNLIEEQGTKSIWTSVLTNGIPFNGMIDTGTSITLVNDKVVKDCNLALKNTSRTFTTASIPCQIEKETMVEIQMGVNKFELPVCVWDNKKYDLLIGLDFLMNVDSIDIKEMKLQIGNREAPIQNQHFNGKYLCWTLMRTSLPVVK
eukprot:NODE_77_length_23806_cov_0.393892.p6 type:complete len:245 gc:universal NODE_77_length_23806_cov_0.393892:7902-8636(+)